MNNVSSNKYIINPNRPYEENVVTNRGLVGAWLGPNFKNNLNSVYTRNEVGNYRRNLNLTLTANPNVRQSPTGKFRSLNFNGTTQYAEGVFGLVTDYPISMSCWIKTTAGAAAYKDPFSLSNSTLGTHYMLFQLGNTSSSFLTFAFNNATTSVNIGTSVVVNDNKWHFLVATLANGSDRKLYSDGILRGTSTTFKTFPTLDRIVIGNVSLGGVRGQPYPGLVSDCRVYNSGLTAADIRLLYQEGLNNYQKTGSFLRISEAPIYEAPPAGDFNFNSANQLATNKAISFCRGF